MPKSRVQVAQPDDLRELSKIAESRPLGRDVLAQAKRIKGAAVQEYADGHFQVTATDARAQHALASMLETPRRLEDERGQKLQAQRETVEVLNRHGTKVRVSPEGETGAARHGLIRSISSVFGAGRGPRCWDQGHDYRDGRCWWCGRLNGADA